jgi:hypothetical protein
LEHDEWSAAHTPLRRVAVALHFVPSLLLGPGVWQPLGEPRDGGVSRHAAVGDGCNDPRGNEGERSQDADVALTETLAFGNLGQSCDRWTQWARWVAPVLRSGWGHDLTSARSEALLVQQSVSTNHEIAICKPATGIVGAVDSWSNDFRANAPIAFSGPSSVVI